MSEQTPIPTSKERSLDKRLRSKIGGFLLEPDTRDGGDTLAIALCSYFEKHIARPLDDTESENGWSQWAEDKTNAALDALTRALSGDSSAPETSPPFQWKDGLPYINGVLASYDQLVTALRPSAQETTENPGAGAPGGVGVVDLAARSTVIPLVNLPPIKAGDKCAHCGERWLLSPDGKGIWHSCHTGIPSKVSRSFRQTSFHNSGPGDRCDHCSMPINEHSDGMYYCPVNGKAE